MFDSPSRTGLAETSPWQRMEIRLLLLALICIVIWFLPSFGVFDGMNLVPMWVILMVELFSIIVSLFLFSVVWNSYSRERSGNYVIFGCAALAIGLLDFARLLSHRGMPDFITPSGPHKAIGFWLAARLITALSLLILAIRPNTPLASHRTRYLLLAASLATTALVYWQALFHPSWLPDTYIEGVGLTGFKIAAEWVIISIMATAAMLLYRNAQRDGTYETANYFGIAVIGVLSELCFTAYASITDIYSVLGHVLKSMFYLFLYHAAFISSVREPFQRLHIEIGERRRAEEALRQLNASLEQRVAQRTAQLEQANKELESFSYSVSHDLRAPLRAIDGFSQILSKNYAPLLDARGQDYFSRIRNATGRMGELIDDLLHLSRVSRQQKTRSKFDLSQLAHDITRQLQQAAPSRQVDIIITPGMTLDADPKLIRIVLENLMGNAWKFTGKRSEARIEVGMTATNSGEPAVFVRDNGAGFNMEYAHKLFNAFQRLHAGSEFEGTGIGLATVQRIISKHGGRAWAEGKEGEGATFYFSCGAS